MVAVAATQKLLCVAFVLVLAFPSEARVIGKYGPPENEVNAKRGLFERVNFGMLPKGSVVSSSVPSRKTHGSSTFFFPHEGTENVKRGMLERANFGLLPKGSVVPLSGPSHKTHGSLPARSD